MTPPQHRTVGTDLHPPCACGHTWSAHLPLAGSTQGRCTVDCPDGCTEYTAVKATGKPGTNPGTDWNPTDDELRHVVDQNLNAATDYPGGTSWQVLGLARLVLREREAHRTIPQAALDAAARDLVTDATARAELAETEIKRLNGVVRAAQGRTTYVEAALARVQALCDATGKFVGPTVTVGQIRAAIAGDRPPAASTLRVEHPDGTNETLTNWIAREPAPTYPRQDGDFTLIGPECFAGRDDNGEIVIAWHGENYVPQPALKAAEANLLVLREHIDKKRHPFQAEAGHTLVCGRRDAGKQNRRCMGAPGDDVHQTFQVVLAIAGDRAPAAR